MFSQTPVYQLATGEVVFGLRQPLTKADSDRVLNVTAPVEDRLDLVAGRLQDNPLRWWAVADLSDLKDPLLEITTGRDLRIPDPARLPD